MDESDVDHGFRRVVAEFIVFAESSGPVEPGEGALDDPSFRQHLKGMLFVPFDDLDGVIKHIAGPVDQLARVAAVGEDPGDRVEAAKQLHQHRPRPGSVLDAGRMDHHRQQVSLRIDREVPLSPLDLLARVVTTAPPFSAVLAD